MLGRLQSGKFVVLLLVFVEEAADSQQHECCDNKAVYIKNSVHPKSGCTRFYSISRFAGRIVPMAGGRSGRAGGGSG